MVLPSSMFAFIFLVASVHGVMPELKNKIPLKHVAVATMAPGFRGDSGAALLLTTFYPFGPDHVYFIPHARSLVNATAIPQLIENVTVWPNQASPAQQGAIAGSENKVVVAGGFFVSPKKSTGTVDIFDVSNYPDVARTQVSEDKKGNFYHHTEWVDVNGDGKLDIVGARCFNPTKLFKKTKAKGELVWFEQPDDPTVGPWKTRVLANGPDVSFTQVNLDGDKNVQFVATQFFTSKQLAIYSCSHPTWSMCENNTDVSVVVLDTGDGAYFNVQWVDLNGDGKKDILATTNEANGKGAVYAFEQPKNWRTDTWAKHVLASGYKPKDRYLPGKGSPGSALAFDLFVGPTGKAAASVPHIMVSGDDMGIVDILSPRQNQSFVYDQIRIINSTNTIGTPTFHNYPNEPTLLFVPLFAESQLGVYSF